MCSDPTRALRSATSTSRTAPDPGQRGCSARIPIMRARSRQRVRHRTCSAWRCSTRPGRVGGRGGDLHKRGQRASTDFGRDPDQPVSGCARVDVDVKTAVRAGIGIITVVLNNGVMSGYEAHIPVVSERYGAKLLAGDFRCCRPRSRGARRACCPPRLHSPRPRACAQGGQFGPADDPRDPHARGDADSNVWVEAGLRRPRRP
jgi:hypothetical protein